MQLRNDQWEKLAPLLAGKRGDPGVRGKNNRLFIEAVLQVAAGGSRWNNLPPEFGKWHTAYMRFKRWNEYDLWRQLMQAMHGDPELSAMLEQIVAYGDQRTERIRQRSVRHANKRHYHASMHAAKTDSQAASTLHWVGLMAEAPPIINSTMPPASA
ncbi:transposase [Paraherbaspirillum soli]|uniref:Transposase n=1 Tax=Paraherbaspirillum soli TaxID=631222 RepID=A0ABW0MDM3_9BURK